MLTALQGCVQFQQPLANFELVKEKLAYMQAGAYAMEAATYETAALIDSGEGDFMLETAMLKVFSTDVLWRIINDTIQIFGGKAYFTDEPYERMMRDARINTIGEGANEVLLAFIAVVGMRDVGLSLKSTLDPKRTFKLKVKTFEPENRMVWGDGKGKRTYTLTRNENGTTTFSMTEKIGGLMFPLYAKYIPPFDATFNRFAADLKQEAEKIGRNDE